MKSATTFLSMFSLLILVASCDVSTDKNTFREEVTLNGTYNLTAIEATPAADLDNDGTANKDLFLETNCFDNMTVTFRADNTFTATNSKLDFKGGENNDEVTCSSRIDNGTYALNDSTLRLTIEDNGQTITDTKDIVLSDTEFSFVLTKPEIDQYVNDNGTSSASNIERLLLVYTKE